MSLIRIGVPESFKTKALTRANEIASLHTGLIQSRRARLAAEEALRDLEPLGGLCQSTAERISALHPDGIPLLAVPSGTLQGGTVGKRLAAQIKNLIISAVLHAASTKGALELISELNSLGKQTLGELDPELYDKITAASLEEHLTDLEGATGHTVSLDDTPTVQLSGGQVVRQRRISTLHAGNGSGTIGAGGVVIR